MPKVRIGFSSDFVLDNSEVGIGTTNPTVTLDVYGVAKADFDITGVATLTSYGGFVSQKQNVSTASTIGFSTTGIGTVGITSFISVNERETGFISLVGEFNTLSEDLIVDDGKILDVSTIRNIGVTTIGTQNVYVPTNTSVSLGTLESVNVTSHFSVPNGGISRRQQHPVEGTVRFNDDLNTLEFWNGVEWRQFNVTGASGRGVFGGGVDGGNNNLSVIEYININSLSNSYYFGEMTVARRNFSTASSEIRGIFSGSNNPVSNILDYITISSQGNAISFGQLSITGAGSGCSSSTRGIFAGGSSPTGTNTIEYIQIQTLGNGLDFGDLTNSVDLPSAVASPTRAVIAGGRPGGPGASTSHIDFITISSKSNAVKFGDLIERRLFAGSCSNSTRGIFAGGQFGSSGGQNTIEYLTIATTGNSIYFGDLTVIRKNIGSSCNATRGVFAGGYDPALVNVMDYVTISSVGNAIDFGDLSTLRRSAYGLSDSHGGLGGF